MDTFLLKRGGVSCLVLCGMAAVLSNPIHIGAPQGLLWHIPVLLPGPLLVLSEDTFSGREIFILPCEYTCEKHVYRTSGLLTQLKLPPHGEKLTNSGKPISLHVFPFIKWLQGWMCYSQGLSFWIKKAVLKESILKEISRAVRAGRSNM